MKIITAKYILSFDETSKIISDGAIAFDKKIVEVGKKDEVLEKYPDAKVEEFVGEKVIMPGLINSHIHLEYLANKTSLEYGEFVKWLKSVVKYREELSQKCSEDAISEACTDLLKSGTTTIGEISSFGLDIEPLKSSKINVILFNEILGSTPATVDVMFQDFLQRWQTSLSLKDDRFIPAISVHSPYSTHPILAKKALEIAKGSKCVVATHFMESIAEREWLESSSGNFEEFLKSFNPNARSMVEPKEFISLFDGIDTLFVHATYANDEEIDLIQKNGNYIVSCPVSNRLLENKKLDISKIKNLTIATDGLTSNISLNLWDELRAALFIHSQIDIDQLSKRLLHCVTKEAADALKLNKGVLKSGYDSDMIVVELADRFDNIDSIYKWLILHTKEAKKIYIQGEEI